MINDIKIELDHIKNVLAQWPHEQYVDNSGLPIDSDQAFIQIEAKLRHVMDSILKLPEKDRIQLKDTIGDFKTMMETRQKEAEIKLEDLRAQATLNKNSKSAMKAYGASLQKNKESV
ncbi:MAG: hypothetical protein COY39_05980 [Alphaproteobacteria bacterium CG_4_10_14_0_8_um_filter_37_21]|nr:MAG: hypothetical protein COY39_05980 [Alphaproteobacteria bacterium CG_4_10_14_0_8_um_filter_37_21]